MTLRRLLPSQVTDALPPPDPVEIVRAELIDGFLAGRYVPGQKLIETEFMAKLGLSRAHLREALGKLDVEGIVTIYHYRGVYVKRFEPEEALSLIQVFAPLLELAARLAAEAVRAKPDIAPLAEVRVKMASPIDNDARLASLRVRNSFYRSLIRLAGNPHLERIFPATLLQLLRMQAPEPDHADPSRERRLAICDAVLAGDETAAVHAAHDYASALLSEMRERLPVI